MPVICTLIQTSGPPVCTVVNIILYREHEMDLAYCFLL